MRPHPDKHDKVTNMEVYAYYLQELYGDPSVNRGWESQVLK